LTDIDVAAPAVRQIDPLTGFLNRSGSVSELSRMAARQGIQNLSVIVAEISRFGAMNDSIGADLGDKIIAMTARRLQKTFPDALMFGRMHGDHFCIAFGPGSNVEANIAKLLDFAQRPFAVRGEVIVLSIRIGAADPRCACESAPALLHAAEVALHRAKRQLNKIAYYNASMIEEARANHRLENDLRVSLVTNAAALHSALANDEFFLCYQPIVSASTGEVRAFEALLRWRHPKNGVISPMVFIPMAEEIRIMDVLGAWILRRACKDAASWPALANGSFPSVSVNVSPTQFEGDNLLEQAVDTALSEANLPAERLKLEITETVAILGRDLAPRLERLRARGCRISLDDFGTGYSSLTQLHMLPLDDIKIDQSFVRGMITKDGDIDEHFSRLTRSILTLANVLELTPIVEGVETIAQLNAIREWGGDMIQGYHYSRPLNAEDVASYLSGANTAANGKAE
jgi:diguanylate cyclase (GGDEF)-like protein